jgi:hypothetical protein
MQQAGTGKEVAAAAAAAEEEEEAAAAVATAAICGVATCNVNISRQQFFNSRAPNKNDRERI